MYALWRSIFLLNVNYWLSVVSIDSTTAGPVRKTIYGNIRGKITSRFKDKEVEEYLGVPFATPPVGSLRFKRPTPSESWSGILRTTTLSPACVQEDTDYIQFHRDTFTSISEDCLYMNIYVPKVKRNGLSVLLYVHGGSNLVGMGAMLDGDILAAHGEIIVITFNYRLGILGFYADQSQGIEGTYGLLDQVEAMKWVQDNIIFFNGDPSKVTLHGHSLGASDVGLHTVSNLTSGLFRYAIIHSGSPIAYWFVSDCVKSSRKTNYPSDCRPGTSRTNKRRLSYKELMEGSIEDPDFISMKGEDVTFGSFPIVIDGYYITDSPETLFKCDRNIHVDSVLIAMTRDETFPGADERGDDIDDLIQPFKSIFPNQDEFEEAAYEAFYTWKQNNISSFPYMGKMRADMIFTTPMLKLADVISKWLGDVYLFIFEYEPVNPTDPSASQDIEHGMDLFYLFGVPFIGHHINNYTKRDKDVSLVTMTLFSNFVKHGNVSTDDSKISQTYNSRRKRYYKLDVADEQPTLKASNNFKKLQFEFWNKFLFAYDHLTCSNNSNLLKIDIIMIIFILASAIICLEFYLLP